MTVRRSTSGVQSGPEGAALTQLKAKRYADKYRDRNEPIHLIGMEFSRAERNLVAFMLSLF